MERTGGNHFHPKSVGRATERPFTTGLYLLRCYQLGLSLADLDVLEYGTTIDMMIEHGNDHEEWQQVATQEDFDRF